jgi:hypothetical protein
MPEIVFRTLRHEYHLLCPDQKSAADMAFMEIVPDMPDFNLRKVDIPLELDQGYYRLRLADDDVTEGSAGQILNRLHRLILDDVLDSEMGCPIFHCGTLINPVDPSGRIAIVGSKGHGKTTLMLSLLAQGFQMEGDEHLVLRENEVVARPRTLRVKTGSLDLVPAFVAALKASPSIEEWDGIHFYSFNPKKAGLAWTIAPGRLDHILILEANHGGRSVIHPLHPELALKKILKEAIFPDQGKAVAFARFRSTILGVKCHSLRNGDLESIGQLLMDVAGRG